MNLGSCLKSSLPVQKDSLHLLGVRHLLLEKNNHHGLWPRLLGLGNLKDSFFLSLSSFRKFTWESYSNKWLSSASCLASPSLASSVTGGKFVNMVVNDDGIRKHFIHFCSEVKIVKSFCSDRCTSSRIKNCLSLLQLAVSYQIWKCVSEQTCRVLATAIRENNLISTSIIIAAQKT